MVESRCGRLCGQCGHLTDGSCPGCVKMARPAWGQCPVKVSCEGKGLEHCGQCDRFPCETLIGFANDKTFGDNGRRIEQCKAWRDAEK